MTLAALGCETKDELDLGCEDGGSVCGLFCAHPTALATTKIRTIKCFILPTLLQHSLRIARPIVPVLRRMFGLRVSFHGECQAEVENKHGLEIGGPSSIFRDTGALPLYRYVGSLDNCVFAQQTIWDERSAGLTFSYHPRKPIGHNFIKDATDMTGVGSSTYDFILSSHALEHIANPIRALKEFTRVVKPGAAVIVIVPNYRYTFDHRRKPTPVAHMIHDFMSGTKEDDQTHVQEILKLHDLSRNPGYGGRAEFEKRVLNNSIYRSMHHHVFDEKNSRALLEATGLTVSHAETVRPNHIVLLAFRRFSEEGV